MKIKKSGEKKYAIVTFRGDDGASEIVSAKELGREPMTKKSWKMYCKKKHGEGCSVEF